MVVEEQLFQDLGWGKGWNTAAFYEEALERLRKRIRTILESTDGN